MATRIEVIDLASGLRKEIARLPTTNPLPLSSIPDAYVTADAKFVLFTSIQNSSDLYLVDGLK